MAAFRSVAMRAATTPARTTFVSNHSGEVARADEIATHLCAQLVHPVDYCRALRGLHASGVTRFVTVGPGRTLRSLVRRTLGDTVQIYAADEPDVLARTAAALATPGARHEHA